MAFKTRKVDSSPILDENIDKEISTFSVWKILKYILLLILFFFVGFVGYFAYSFFKPIENVIINPETGEKEVVMKNILLMGSGGADHEGGFLTDSIIVASVNYDLKSVSLLSIPRDLHVRYLIEKRNRSGKINHVFLDGMNHWRNKEDDMGVRMENASEYLKTEIEEIMGLTIHNSVYIDFNGFVKVVDELGGLRIDVEKSINDPLYPGPNHTYRPFILSAGDQILPGNVALKYVRSRHGNAGGDFGRSQRQKTALISLKDAALNSGVFTSPSKIQSMLGIISENFWTDMSLDEMIEFGKIAKDIEKDDVTTGGIKDLTEKNTAWFLYTPPRDLFNGQAVLLPCRINSKTPWSDIQLYQTILSKYPELLAEDGIISVYNTTKTGGMATEISNALLRYAIKTSEIGNKEEVSANTLLQYVSSERNDEIAEFLEDTFGIPAAEVSQEFLGTDQFRFLIGEDYVSTYRKDMQWYLKCL